jgi:hypothetical protein
VDNSVLMAEMERFTEECFVKARSRFAREGIATTDESLIARIDTLIEAHGEEDVDWPGSHVFQELPGYYDHYRAEHPVAGWPYDPARDLEPEYQDAAAQLAGRPTCKDWWAEPERGLRKRVLEGSDKDIFDRVKQGLGWASSVWDPLSDEKVADKIVRRAWDNSQIAAPADASFAHSYNREGWTDSRTGGLNWHMAGAGVGLTGFMAIFKPSMYAVRAGAPMMQPLILLAIVMLLPFAIVFSNYSWTMVGIGSLALFTVKFWSYLWFIAKWLEDQLTLAMFPSASDFLSTSLANLTDGDFALKATLLELITALMYFVLPLAFSMIMAWAGFHAMAAVAAVGQSFRQKTEEGGGLAGRAVVQQTTQRIGGIGKK